MTGRRGLRGILTLAAYSCARVVQAGDPPLEELRRFETPHYIIAATSQSEALQVATHAAEIEQALGVKFELAPRASQARPTLLLLTAKQVDRYLAVVTRDQRTAFSNASHYLLLPSGAGASRLRRAVYHQVAHVFVQAQFDAPLPYWYEEGLALVSETLRVDGQQAEMGRQRFSFRDRDTAETQEGNRVMTQEGPVQTVPNWISLSRVLDCTESCSEFPDGELRYQMRREQWALVHRALVGDDEFGKQVANYLQLWRQRMPIEQAVQQSFGSSIEGLDRKMRAYASREKFATARLQLEKPADSLREIQAFGPGELADMLASPGWLHTSESAQEQRH
jgi:hypothetical protein